MKINAINVVAPKYNNGIVTKNNLKHEDVPTTDIGTSVSKGYTTVSFKGGNAKHLFHQISELQMFGFSDGGVGTVGNDLFFNHEGFDRIIENIPLYNQEMAYEKDVDAAGKVQGIKTKGVALRKIPQGLSDDHPFKPYENSYFVTSKELNAATNIADFLKIQDNADSVFILDEIGTKTMTWGLEDSVDIGIYSARKDDRFKEFLKTKRGWTDEMINKADITFTYVDATGSLPKQYANGGYSFAKGDVDHMAVSAGWKGDAYAKEAKATAELMPILKEKFGGFDPKYVTCHDGQAMSLIHFMAEKNAAGEEFYRDKVITSVGHNLNDGYLGTVGVKDAIITIAKPGEIEKIINSPEYFKALRENRETEFLQQLLPKEMLDARGQASAAMISIAYGEKGYNSMFTTVSNGYYKALIENELLSPAVYKKLKNLSAKGRFNGIINVLMDPNVSGFTINGLQPSYKDGCKIQLPDGQEIEIEKFLAFDETKSHDLSSMREVKRHNKISLLRRLNPEFEKAKFYSVGDGRYLEEGTGFSAAIAGRAGRKVSLVGGIDKKYLDMLEKGQDVPMFVSWGRGDFQKGMDTGLEAFVNYVRKTGDKNSIYVFGGDMKNCPDVVSLTKKLSKDPDFTGRIVMINGWTPGTSLAAAGDYAVLASRFAPCELTDLESMKKGCIPIVPKVQGMDQKVFDPEDTEHAKYVNGYKGLHEFYMTEEEALKLAKQEDIEAFNKVKGKISAALKKEYKLKIGEEIPDELLNKQLIHDRKYVDALQKLRDSVISEELSDCLSKAIQDRNTDVAQRIWENHVDLKTTWKENGWMSSDGLSSAEQYRKLHWNDKPAKNLTQGEELHLNLSSITENVKTNPEVKTKSNFWKSKGGKWTIVGLAVLAVAGGVLAILKGKGNKVTKPALPTEELTKTAIEAEKVAEEVVGENLSAVV